MGRTDERLADIQREADAERARMAQAAAARAQANAPETIPATGRRQRKDGN